MPSLEVTRELIETFVKTNVIDIPLSYDNVEYDGDPSYYAHLTIFFLNDANANIGSFNSKRIRHQGVIVFKVFTELNIGTGKMFSALDYIKSKIENKYIDSNLFTYVAQPTRQGVGSEGNYTYFLRIPFVSDEC